MREFVLIIPVEYYPFPSLPFVILMYIPIDNLISLIKTILIVND